MNLVRSGRKQPQLFYTSAGGQARHLPNFDAQRFLFVYQPSSKYIVILTQVLARKWRPKVFTELAGQDHIVKAIANSLDRNRLHHAYLFSGTRGVGKTTIARILAKALNCDQGITSQPCGQCTTCLSIDQGTFVDLVELDAASNTQVDHMRELLESAYYAPSVARFKIYLIDEVHMLSKSAFNAMLKTLEEPPNHVKFILATTDPQKLPITVLSRCLQFNLKQIPPALIVSRLQHILSREQIKADLPALQLIARAACGSLRDALSLLDQAIAYGNGVVEENQVRDMLGTIDLDYLYDLLEALSTQDGHAMIAIADQMEARSLSFDSALQNMGVLLHRLALAQIAPQAIDEAMLDRERFFDLVKRFSPEEIQLYYQIVLHGRHDLSLAPDDYAGFTMTLMRMLAFVPEQDLASFEYNADDKKAEPAILIPNAKPVAEKPVTHDSSQAEQWADSDYTSQQWLSIVKQLKLSGMAKMLAQHCEAKFLSEGKIALYVPELHKHLLEKRYQDRLKQALEDYFKKTIDIKFLIGTLSGMTVAAIEDQEKQLKQSQAIAAIEADPFVREVVENFDAKLIVSSIKPIN